MPNLLTLPGHDASAVARAVQQAVGGFAWRFALLLAGLGLCDYLYQRAMFWSAAAMTRPELQQDLRETEGPWLVRWWRNRRRGS